MSFRPDRPPTPEEAFSPTVPASSEMSGGQPPDDEEAETNPRPKTPEPPPADSNSPTIKEEASPETPQPDSYRPERLDREVLGLDDTWPASLDQPDSQPPAEAILNRDTELDPPPAEPAQEGPADLDQARADYLLVSLRSLPAGPDRLEASAKAAAESRDVRHRLIDIGLTPEEMVSIALRLADRDPAMFVDMIRASGLRIARTESLALARDIASDRSEYFSDVVEALRLDEHDIASVIGQSDPDARRRLLRSFGQTGEFEPHLAQPVERDSTPEDREALARIESAEWSMALALAKDFPERTESERQRARTAEELSRPIKEKAEISQGMNGAIVVTLEERSVPAIFKPRSRESGLDRLDPIRPRLRSGIDPGSYGQREWLAYQVNRALGLDIVPVTLYRHGPDGVGSIQDWKPGKTASSSHFVKLARTNRKVWEGLEDLAFFDCSVTNTDRHDNNWLIQPDDSIEGIDNGLIAPVNAEKPNDVGNTVRCWPLWAVGGQPLPERHRQGIERFRQSEELREALRQCYLAALGQDGEAAWNQFLASLENLEKNGLPKLGGWDLNSQDAITRNKYLDSSEDTPLPPWQRQPDISDGPSSSFFRAETDIFDHNQPNPPEL